MRGIILAGGEGTRLMPLTRFTNKHLLRIGRLPMIEYPLRRMVQAGVRNVHIVVGGESFPPIIRYLESGSRWGISVTYSVQDKPGGIAEALGMAEGVVGNDKMLVILGDNMFDMDLSEEVKRFEISTEEKKAVLFSIHSNTPERFGVLEFGEDGRPTNIIEKPEVPPSNSIVTGVYMYGPEVFSIIKDLQPSERGELEITDVNCHYMKRGLAEVVEMNGHWTDCGTFETLLAAEEMIREDEEHGQEEEHRAEDTEVGA